MPKPALGSYLTLEEFCTRTQAYRKYADQINPFPNRGKTLPALEALFQNIIVLVIDESGRDSPSERLC